MSKLLRAVEKYRLWLIPPATEAGVWLARTGDGDHDKIRMGGSGSTPEEAIKDALTNKEVHRE